MSSIASADVLERRSSGHTQDQFTGYCPQPSSLMQGDGEEMTGSGRTPYSDDKLMPKSATDGVSFMDETAQSQSFALDASPIPQQHSQMGLTLQEEEEEGGEEDGGMHGHPPAYHEQGQHTLTAGMWVCGSSGSLGEGVCFRCVCKAYSSCTFSWWPLVTKQ